MGFILTERQGKRKWQWVSKPQEVEPFLHNKPLTLCKRRLSKHTEHTVNITEMHVKGPGCVKWGKYVTLHHDLENTSIFILLLPGKVTLCYNRFPRWLIYSIPFALRVEIKLQCLLRKHRERERHTARSFKIFIKINLSYLKAFLAQIPWLMVYTRAGKHFL